MPNQPHTRTERLLLEAARTFNTTLEYEELIGMVLRLVMRAVDAEAALVFRIDHERTDMKVRMLKTDEEKVSYFYRELGQGVVGWVHQYREPLIINDPEADERVDREFERLADVKFRSLISVPLVGQGIMIGVVTAINKQNGGFGDDDLEILTGLNNQLAVAINNAHLYRQVKREALEKEVLYEIGMKLSGSLSLDELLREILASLKQAVDFDSGAIFLADPDSGELKSLYAVGYEKIEEKHMNLKIGQGLVGHVATSGEAVIVPDVTADERYVDGGTDTKSEIAVPIKADNRLIGVLNLESKRLNAFNMRSQSLIDAFAAQAAISLERARLHEQLLDGQKLKEQLNIARETQRSFLPDQAPIVPGYDFYGHNVSSGQVGGDYYDFIPIVDHHMGIAIADVSGKGMPAALIGASFRASLIAEIRNNYSIRTIGEKVNSLLCESLDAGNFVTGVYGVLDSKNHIFTFSNFGHNPPLMLRDGTIEYLVEGGPILGVAPGSLYEERALLVSEGAVLVLYTDGITEVFASNGQEFGADGLKEVVIANATRSAQEIAQAIIAATRSHAAPDHVFDDLTLVVVKRLA